MKRIKCIALVSALVLAAGGCSDDPELYITLPESQSKVMNIDAKTQSITVNVEHNVDMEVTISEEAKTWLTQGGTTENTYTFNAAENDDTAERKATITFANTANGLSQTVEVTQAGAEPAIVISNPKVELAADSTFTIEVKHNVEVEVAISEEATWLTQVEAETRAMTTNTYTFNAAENPDTTARKATITFTDTSSNLCDTVEVTQAGRELEDISKNISDAIFKDYCLDKYDSNKDGKITLEEVTKVTRMDVHSKEIQSLDGIEYFTSLTYLECSHNQLTNLDVSKNTALTDLRCNKNQLTDLNVNGCTELSRLWCQDNQLTSLSASTNVALKNLHCANNRLTNLDVSENENLTSLNCFSNQLTNLDLSKNTVLSVLQCYSNPLKSLDVSQNTALTSLNCSSIQLESLDVSTNTALTKLDCSINQLTSLDVSKNTKLVSLDCYSNQLTNLDVSQNTALTSLFCYSNQLTSLDVSKNAALKNLKCYSNQLTSLDVSKTNLGYNSRINTIDCAPMDDKEGENTLDTLTLKNGWSIKGITDGNRSDDYIPEETKIEFVE